VGPDEWVRTSAPSGSYSSLAVRGAGTSSPTLFAGSDSGLFRSTNSGASWASSGLGITTPEIQALAVIEANVPTPLILAGSTGGVFLSTNDGLSWTASSTGIPTGYGVNTFLPIGTDLYVGTNNGVFRSTNNGATWTAASNGLPAALFVEVLAATTNGSSQTLFVGTDGYGIYISNDKGASWTAESGMRPNPFVGALAVKGTRLFAGTTGGVFVSNDNGSNWAVANAGIMDTDIFTFSVHGSDLFVGTSTGVLRSTNNGTNWVPVNTGLIETSVLTFVESGATFFVGTDGDGVWQRPLAQLVSSAVGSAGRKSEQSLVVYPNPISTIATIHYSIERSSSVSLVIYDALGRVVATLLRDRVLQAGPYDATYNAKDLPPGIYLCRLVGKGIDGSTKLVLTGVR
jgi:ligand-binding sensor domain-containing protein